MHAPTRSDVGVLALSLILGSVIPVVMGKPWLILLVILYVGAMAVGVMTHRRD